MKQGLRLKRGSCSASALVAAILLAGCGGGGGGNGTKSSGDTTSTTGLPVIKTQPVTTTALSGSSVTLKVVATGSGTLTYQWKKEGTAISGATAASYTIASVTTATAGNYTVDVTNEIGTTTSSVAVVKTAVAAAPRITTQPLSHGAVLGTSTSFSVTVSGSGTIAYQWYKDGVAIDGAMAPTLTINPVASSSAASYTVTASNTLGNVTSDAATLTIGSVPAIESSPSSTTINAGQALALSVTASGTAPLTYKWTKTSGTNSGVISGATGATLAISNTTTATAGTYNVTVTNAYGSVTSGTAIVTVVGAPTITTQPTSLTVGNGDAATFSVVATGTGSLTYQWMKDGAAISGATSSTYTIASTSATDDADYTVAVSNAAGTTTSNTVSLTVVEPPSITTQPASLTVVAGQSATFSVTASATGALTYQWYRNGAIIVGATGSTYSIATTSTSDNGATFKVEVRNEGLAPKMSNSATLTVTTS